MGAWSSPWREGESPAFLSVKVTGTAWRQLVHLVACSLFAPGMDFVLTAFWAEHSQGQRLCGAHLPAQVQLQGLEDSPQLALKGWGWGDWQMVDVRVEKDAISAVIHKLPVFTAV